MANIKNIWRQKKALIIVLLLSLLLLTVLILSFNTTARRVERGMKKADKAYEEGSYFLAGGLYDKVIALDEANVLAYFGMVSSYAQSDNEGARDLGVQAYERALAVFKALSADEYNANNETVVKTLRYGKELFEDRDNKLSVLESAYEVA